MRRWTLLLFFGAAAALASACPRETESPFYGGQPVQKTLPEADRSVTEDGGGVLEGATQPHRQDK